MDFLLVASDGVIIGCNLGVHNDGVLCVFALLLFSTLKRTLLRRCDSNTSLSTYRGIVSERLIERLGKHNVAFV